MSSIKRYRGVKDWGHTIEGHGRAPPSGDVTEAYHLYPVVEADQHFLGACVCSNGGAEVGFCGHEHRTLRRFDIKCAVWWKARVRVLATDKGPSDPSAP